MHGMDIELSEDLYCLAVTFIALNFSLIPKVSDLVETDFAVLKTPDDWCWLVAFADSGDNGKNRILKESTEEGRLLSHSGSMVINVFVPLIGWITGKMFVVVSEVTKDSYF